MILFDNTYICIPNIRELKNQGDDFVDDDRKWNTVHAKARLTDFVVVVSSTTPNTVESRRPAIHKLRLV